MAEIVADVADQPGALPLLQYALTELFERREDVDADPRRPTGEIGGVSGALARRAEELYGRLDAAGPRGHAPAVPAPRHPRRGGRGHAAAGAPVASSTSLDVDREAMDAADRHVRSRRLLSFDRDPATREPTVEVAHEALLSAWGRLRGWIETAREDVRTARRLAAGGRRVGRSRAATRASCSAAPASLASRPGRPPIWRSRSPRTSVTT